MTNWDSNSAQSKGMSNRNDVTGDKLQTKIPSQEYKDNYDDIFRKPKSVESDEQRGERE